MKLIMLGFVLALGGVAAGARSTLPSSQDAHFVDAAARANRAEILIAQLVLTRTSDPSVRDAAKMLVHDHKAAGAKLERIARAEEFSVPVDLASADQRLYARLQVARGTELDREFVTAMIAAHEDAILLFGGEVNGGSDPLLVGFARDTLPTLRKHLEVVREITPEARSSAR